jgi:hypothetical protein
LVIANCILVTIQPNQRSAQRAGIFGGVGEVAVVVTAIDDAISATTVSRLITSGSGASKLRARHNLCEVNETDLLR